MKEDIVRITKKEDLRYLGYESNQHFVIENDIDMESKPEIKVESFDGVLDGNGHCIKNLEIDKLYTRTGSIIGVNNGIIKNLEIRDSKIVSKGNTGGICRVNQGKIENCHFSGEIKTENSVTGGITSINSGEIINCEFNGKLRGEDFGTGGIAGINKGILDDCHSSGEILGFFIVGGITGENEGIIDLCSSDSMVKARETPNNTIAGIAGRNCNKIQNSYFSGEIEAILYHYQNGVLIGNNSGKVENTHYEGNTLLPLIGEKRGTSKSVSRKDNAELYIVSSKI